MRGKDVQRDSSQHGRSVYEQIHQFYNEVVDYSANGVKPKEKINIHSISSEHIIAYRTCGKYTIVVMMNRGSKRTRIPIPRQYAEAQVIFQKGEVEKNYFQPKAVLVLKM